MSEIYSNNNPQPGDSERQLLVKILTALNGSSSTADGVIQGAYGHYAGDQPTWTPTGTNLGIAIDLDSSPPYRIWYYTGSWN